jgi:hypothetical protein
LTLEVAQVPLAEDDDMVKTFPGGKRRRSLPPPSQTRWIFGILGLSGDRRFR